MELFSLPIFPYHHAQSPNLHGHSKGRGQRYILRSREEALPPREKEWEEKGKNKGKGNKTTGRRIGNPIIDDAGI